VIESLPTIAVPTLVVVGEHDATFLAGSRYMAEKIPGAELAIIPGAGHSPNVSKPAEFHATLDRFLAGNASARR
jgi:pimeloyl-ACP methyl ester carboxylesterase